MKRSAAAVRAAAELLERLDIRAPDEIDLELIAAHLDAYVLYDAALPAGHGRLVRVGRRAVIRVRDDDKASARGRSTIAHEIGHHVLHREVDRFGACVGDAFERKAVYKPEREANDFAAELRMPRAMLAPACAGDRVTLADVLAHAARFRCSLRATAIRVTEVARAACAVVVAKHERVAWWSASAAFRGETARGRPLGAWETGIVEERCPLEDGVELRWLTHAR